MHWAFRVAFGTSAVAAVLAFAACGGLGGAQQAAFRMQSQNNLKNLGLGVMQHVDVSSEYPPAFSTDAEGKPLLSWRVHILPFIEEKALYDQFHLDEPWDSEHNKTLIAKMPQVYRFPGSDETDTTTRYVALVHPDGVFTGDATKVGFSELKDGSTNTVLLVEGDPEFAVTWTKPEDIDFDPEHPMIGLGKAWPDGFNVLIGDLRAILLRSDTPPETIKALVTRKGGEIVELP
ncbi:MAG: DUF1559 domain-containing protein [Pirellulaceae bacterium]